MTGYSMVSRSPCFWFIDKRSILGCMKADIDIIRQAREYLAENAALRQAVGAADGVVLEPRSLGAGEHNLNYWFSEPASGSKYVLRVNVLPQPFHDNQVAYEFAALEALASSGCTPLPVFLDDSPAALGEGVIVETFCEGDMLDFDHLQPGDLECAARLMADVHAVPVAADCPLFKPRDPLRALYDECLQRFRLYRASAFEDERLTQWVEKFIAVIERWLGMSTYPATDCQHIINTETLPSHFILPRKGADHTVGVGAFIDWERPIVGEVAQDVAYFVSPTSTFWDSDWLCPANMAEQVVDDYWRAVDGRFDRGNFDERFQLYRAMTVLRSTTWCCRALIRYNQEGAYKTGRTVEKLPVYLSDDFLARLYEECFIEARFRSL